MPDPRVQRSSDDTTGAKLEYVVLHDDGTVWGTIIDRVNFAHGDIADTRIPGDAYAGYVQAQAFNDTQVSEWSNQLPLTGDPVPVPEPGFTMMISIGIIALLIIDHFSHRRH